MSPRFALILALTLLPLQQAGAAAFTLYNDSLGNLPSQQEWLFSANDGILNGGIATQQPNSSGVNLVTDHAVSAGYSNYEVSIILLPWPPTFNYTIKNALFPSLDRDLGFSLEFELDLVSEIHDNDHRAGFSVLLLAQDMLGIEIGFWSDLVWAQNVGFTHGEERQFDTSGEQLYELAILGDNYSLSAVGEPLPLLSGSLRDYSAEGTPYNLPSFLFLGDDTGSAGAEINLGQVTLNTNEPASVPAPPAPLLLLLGLLLIGGLQSRQRGRS